MLDKEKSVQGVGVYAEFRKPGQVMQVMLTPDCYSTTGSVIPMALLRRIVTPTTPRKQWKTTMLRSSEVQEFIENGLTLPDSEKENFAEARMRYATTYFDSILAGGWELEKSPILVEVSRGDADDISKGKTPNKILYRIHISRKSAGFPELV